MDVPKLQPVTFAISLAICTGALADDTAQPDQAKAAFEEGATLFADGEFPAAAEAFRHAYEIKPSWRLLYNIGQSEAAAKRHGLAMEAFERYLSQGGDDIDEARRIEVTGEIERLRTIVGTIEIAAPDGSLVVIDDVERGHTPLSGRLKVAAGVEHQVEIRQGDQVLLARSVSVGGRENQLVEAKPGDEVGAVVAEPTSEPEDEPVEAEEQDAEPMSPLSTAGWATLGVGGGLVITGAVTGIVALSRNEQLVSACDDADGCPTADYRDVRDKRDAMATTSTVMFAVGAAAATAGVIMLVMGRGGDEDEATTGDGAGVTFAPSAGPGHAGVAVSGRF